MHVEMLNLITSRSSGQVVTTVLQNVMISVIILMNLVWVELYEVANAKVATFKAMSTIEIFFSENHLDKPNDKELRITVINVLKEFK